MSIEQNKAIVRRFYDDVFTRGKIDVMDEIFASDCVCYLPGGEAIRGLDGLKDIISAVWRGAFPDVQFNLEDVIGEGDKVVIRHSAHGTHKGEIWGVAPTHKRVTWTANDIHRIAEGKIVEVWAAFDQFGMMQQIRATGS